ncbi:MULTISPECIES: hypothetical protein [Rhizobium]|uniref:hypothetical protein n=1 Tax=Rhizobium TaxID=379 RepID=UPI001EF80C70|nr:MULTISPECIES: hypothetical protein [Rhizobium]ULJ72370.1 hypothetical protein L2W42_01135 [Rhizobium gallicum]WFU86313.1 hypothetical protein QA644_14350 [Rhizobium sp. CC1099]
MADYNEVPGPTPFRAIEAEVAAIKWKQKTLHVELIKKEGAGRVRIVFRDVVAWRVLDGLAIDSEDGHVNTGLSSTGLTYMVEGAHFWQMHSGLLVQFPKAKHFRIVTLDIVIDAIAESKPSMLGA